MSSTDENISELTHERLLEVFIYQEDGFLIRKVRTSNRSLVGAVAGSKNKNGYTWVQIDKGRYSLHRLIWFYHHSKWPENFIDHIDGNPSNNKIENLREATHSQNLRNMKKKKNNKSGYKGVFFDKAIQKWVAAIWWEGRRCYLGSFLDAKEASIAYQNAAKEKYGEFARIE